MSRITKKHLEGLVDCINANLVKLNKEGRYGVQHCYGYTNVVFYSDPHSSGCSDVRCGLSTSEAYDVLYGINDVLNVMIYRK